MRLFWLVALVTGSAAAYADPPGMTNPSQFTTTQIAPAPNELDTVTRGDAASDRGFAFDTGVVLGAGQVELGLRTLLEKGTDLSVAVGVGGGVELSVDGIDALGDRFEALGGGVRVRVARGPRYALSAAAAYHWANANLDDTEPFEGGYLTVGGDLALAVNEQLLMSFGLGVVRYADGGDGSDSSTSFYGHVDLLFGGSWARLLVEVGDIAAPFAIVGGRFATRHVSVDLGVGLTGDNLDDDSSAVVMFGVSVRP
ncbi:MAG TPA: hypothetical protein VH143_31340 [Kofleriaceae bacterium]|jgi:hypothetical protein|nr:hypothetical protein [Kofleriaceae bacterium]